MSTSHLWIRSESRDTERRAPVVPGDVRALRDAGLRVSVESSERRVFGDEEYAAAGCEIAPAGSWVTDAPDGAVVLGIKELPDDPAELRHTHVAFGHAYKGQHGAAALLARFRRGGGRLLDLESLAVGGRRVVAFGYWAGYVGASLGLLAARGAFPDLPLQPMERAELDERLRATAGLRSRERYLVTGSRGRSGTGARDAIDVAGGRWTGWDVEETKVLARDLLLSHEVMVNCVVAHEVQPPFVQAADLGLPGRLMRLIVDVTCDVTSEKNMLPINREVTTWDKPIRRVSSALETPLDVIAIDNLPSLLPREASVTFSADLVPQLIDLARAGADGPLPEAWASAQADFDAACRRELG